MNFIRWEPAIRAMFHGRPLYDASLPITSSRGVVIDPAAVFPLTDDTVPIRDFLDATGYVLLKNVFSEQELTLFRSGAEKLKSMAKEGDNTSWWGKNQRGDAVLTRVIHAAVLAEFNRLYQHPQVKKIEAMLPELKAMSPDEVDGVTVVYKNPAMVAGLSDLPWHRDCGLGGHAVMCPKIICSIYLYDATPAAGALKFLPGSHKASFGFMDANDNAAPTGVTVAAKAGDVSLHYSDVMHCAPPPALGSHEYRISVLLNFDRDFQHHRGQRHYNDVLLGSEDGQIDHLAKAVEKA
ncbi:phytanoyl-CoA dioxygenase family protein [Oceanicoccus sp. KOV_DT_Chl]|uniref:phytanoyl-CoA dioxygenase family protein n=1 Tax=Oceanicoccus sp. KOV_DT_Chl TaxID=1904639 RepID=UPI000C7E7DB7|nr:phytanoyl-CoA dioxygenase family protein [Oceanicoccus sp. KOV_DT_Chl]